jgi:hypothetical protein
MQRPLSVTIISKDPKTLREIHQRFDVQTNYPRLKLCAILLRAVFSFS